MPTLHITNGDSAAATLRHIVDGPVMSVPDVLHEGPAPRVDDDAWYDVRARFLGGDEARRVDEIRAGFAASDRAIAQACARGDDLLLWFEHDLFDQLLIIRLLDFLVACQPSRISMICIDRFPGVERFIGLGQLTAAELATLVDTRRPVTSEQYALATRAWDAFRAPDPRGLQQLALSTEADIGALPFLGDALKRFLAEFPSTANGLSHTEALALQELSAGPMPAHGLFRATQEREARPFMGDWPFYDMLRRLTSARVPLVSAQFPPGDRDVSSCIVAITDAGRDVLAGRADALELSGIDCWRGGVRLSGRNRSPWRWDAGRETLVS